MPQVSAKNQLHTPAWFDYCFEGATPSVPADLRKFAEAVCVRFCIRGICDPMYIANVAAHLINRGDGRSNFVPDDRAESPDFAQALSKIHSQLCFAYSTCIGPDGNDLRLLVQEHLRPKDTAPHAFGV